jgi:hypothetical protein
MKIDNGTGGSRQTSTGKPERVDERGRESINFFTELKQCLQGCGQLRSGELVGRKLRTET